MNRYSFRVLKFFLRSRSWREFATFSLRWLKFWCSTFSFFKTPGAMTNVESLLWQILCAQKQGFRQQFLWGTGFSNIFLIWVQDTAALGVCSLPPYAGLLPGASMILELLVIAHVFCCRINLYPFSPSASSNQPLWRWHLLFSGLLYCTILLRKIYSVISQSFSDLAYNVTHLSRSFIYQINKKRRK